MMMRLLCIAVVLYVRANAYILLLYSSSRSSAQSLPSTPSPKLSFHGRGIAPVPNPHPTSPTASVPTNTPYLAASPLLAPPEPASESQPSPDIHPGSASATKPNGLRL